MVASAREYDAAKKRHGAWSEHQHQKPTPEMLADVDLIRAYEHAQNKAAQKRADAEDAARRAAEQEESDR